MGGVRVDMRDQIMAELKFLTGLGYGATESDVVRYLVERSLDDLRRSGVIPAYCECGKQKP